MLLWNYLQAGSAYFGYERYRQGADSAFATAYETGMGGPGGAQTPGSGINKNDKLFVSISCIRRMTFLISYYSWRIHIFPWSGCYY